VSDEPNEIHVRIEGELRPPHIIAMNTAIGMCKEAGWTVETVIVHQLTPQGLCMWRLDGEE
jgi:hypothetical protein